MIGPCPWDSPLEESLFYCLPSSWDAWPHNWPSVPSGLPAAIHIYWPQRVLPRRIGFRGDVQRADAEHQPLAAVLALVDGVRSREGLVEGKQRERERRERVPRGWS